MKKKIPRKSRRRNTYSDRNGGSGGNGNGLTKGELANQLAAANAVVMTNMAKAAIAGYAAFKASVTDDNADRPGFRNGLYQGAVNGFFAALLESWNSAPQSLKDIVDEILTGQG